MYKNKHRFAICVYVWGRFTHTTGSQLQIIIFCFIYFVRLFARRWRRRRRWQAWVVEKQKSMINTPVALNNKYFVGDSSFCFSVSFVRDVVFRISLTIHINFNGAKKRKEKQLVLQKWSHKKCCAHRMHSPVHYSLSTRILGWNAKIRKIIRQQICVRLGNRIQASLRLHGKWWNIIFL